MTTTMDLDVPEIERLADSLTKKLPFMAPELMQHIVREYVATAWAAGCKAGITRTIDGVKASLGTPSIAAAPQGLPPGTTVWIGETRAALPNGKAEGAGR